MVVIYGRHPSGMVDRFRWIIGPGSRNDTTSESTRDETWYLYAGLSRSVRPADSKEAAAIPFRPPNYGSRRAGSGVLSENYLKA